MPCDQGRAGRRRALTWRTLVSAPTKVAGAPAHRHGLQPGSKPANARLAPCHFLRCSANRHSSRILRGRQAKTIGIAFGLTPATATQPAKIVSKPAKGARTTPIGVGKKGRCRCHLRNWQSIAISLRLIINVKNHGDKQGRRHGPKSQGSPDSPNPNKQRRERGEQGRKSGGRGHDKSARQASQFQPVADGSGQSWSGHAPRKQGHCEHANASVCHPTK